MSEAEVVEVETALGVKLPAFYRDVLLNYPKDLLDYFRSEEGALFNWMFFSEPAELTATNPLTDPRYFAIGCYGKGGFWCIDLAGESDAVRVHPPRSGTTWHGQPSLRDFIAMLRAEFLGDKG